MNTSFDPYTPAEMAGRVEAGGVAKSRLDVGRTLALGVLAGSFIALGAAFSTVVGTEAGLGYGPNRLLVGASFSLGLVLVGVGGAELFTGNNLIVMAWAAGRVSTLSLLRNWALVYVGNFVGAAATALGVYLSGVAALGSGKVGQTALAIAAAKMSLTWSEAFFRGVFCNALVCLAVWLGFSARSTTDKILCTLGPVTAFVAIGFEHSIANMYFLPMGMLLQPTSGGSITVRALLLDNLVPVTLGNVVGGSVMVGLVYWFVYLRPDQRRPASEPAPAIRADSRADRADGPRPASTSPPPA